MANIKIMKQNSSSSIDLNNDYLPIFLFHMVLNERFRQHGTNNSDDWMSILFSDFGGRFTGGINSAGMVRSQCSMSFKYLFNSFSDVDLIFSINEVDTKIFDGGRL